MYGAVVNNLKGIFRGKLEMSDFTEKSREKGNKKC